MALCVHGCIALGHVLRHREHHWLLRGVLMVPGQLLGLATWRRLHVLPHLHARLLERHGRLLLLLKHLLLLLLLERLLLLQARLLMLLLLVWAGTVGHLVARQLLLGVVSLLAILLLACIHRLLVRHLLSSANVPMVPLLLVHPCNTALNGEADTLNNRQSNLLSNLL